MDYDKTDMPRGYDRGRNYSAAQLERWISIISQSVRGLATPTILDLGCGTGRYSTALAQHLGARVIASDPSQKMLAQARSKRDPRVTYIRARGEFLPIRDKLVDMVFMSMVFHHFNDRIQVLQECHRVLRKRGFVCLRAGTVEQIENYAYVPFFPQTRPLLQRTLDSRGFIEATFRDRGFDLDRHQLVPSEAAQNWHAYAERLGYRADSILVQLSDRDFDGGLEAVRRHAATAPRDQPVVELIDFFVFRSA